MTNTLKGHLRIVHGSQRGIMGQIEYYCPPPFDMLIAKTAYKFTAY